MTRKHARQLLMCGAAGLVFLLLSIAIYLLP